MHALPEDVCVLCLLTHGAQLAHPPRPAGFPPHLTYSCGVQCTHGSALLGGAASPGLATARAVGQRTRSAAQATGTAADAGACATSVLRKTPGFEPLQLFTCIP